MLTQQNLIESDYEITPFTNLISLAQSKLNNDKFLFSVRMKQLATFRRITGTWELGIDTPDYELYCAAKKIHSDIPFIIFFETMEPQEIKWIYLDTVSSNGRKWQDAVHFPRGIIFIKTSDTCTLQNGVLFTHSHVIQQKLGDVK